MGRTPHRSSIRRRETSRILSSWFTCSCLTRFVKSHRAVFFHRSHLHPTGEGFLNPHPYHVSWCCWAAGKTTCRNEQRTPLSSADGTACQHADSSRSSVVGKTIPPAAGFKKKSQRYYIHLNLYSKMRLDGGTCYR